MSILGYDTVIIYSGFDGSVSARPLIEKGCKLAVLELGCVRVPCS